ncbi:LCP family protein [Salana multivorans]|nr:LCP family protein [Salana multivorans]
MPDDVIPPSFEPGSGRRIDPVPPRTERARPAAAPSPGRTTSDGASPAPRRVPRSAAAPPRSGATPGAPARRPAARPPRTAPDVDPSAGLDETAARPIPVRGSGASGRSRTDPALGATRAVPMGTPPASGARPVRVGGSAGSSRPGGPGGPGGPGRPPGGAPRPSARPPSRSRAVYRRRRIVVGILVVLVLLLAWPIGLVVWANGKIQHVDALTDRAPTPGTTYLLAGSDSRDDGSVGDQPDVTGARTDTIMLLTAPASGTPSLISLPRDVPIDYPGQGKVKLNAAYVYGGPEGLVSAVEGLTGITVDHYVEIGMLGVENVVDAVGGINLCWDTEVHDPESGMEWTPGCHDVDGAQALAFARMRKADPTGDIGRQLRQRMVIQAVMSEVKGTDVLVPGTQVKLVNAVTGSLVTSTGTGIIDLGKMALTFRDATGPNGYQGTPPIADYDYRGDGIGSTILLDPDGSALMWQQILDGTLPKAKDAEG